MSSFDNIVLPARCACGDVTVYATLGDLAAGPVDIACPTCGQTHQLSVAAEAVRLRDALAMRMEAEADADACSILIGRDAG